jgi:hypothetical protein
LLIQPIAVCWRLGAVQRSAFAELQMMCQH